jgi:hypothetical protein
MVAAPLSSTPSFATPIADKARLHEEIAKTQADLVPISRREASNAIALMLKAYGGVAGPDDDASARLYIRAAEGQPVGAVRGICEELAFGHLRRLGQELLDYPPKVPRFAELVRTRAAQLEAKLRNRRRSLDQLVRLPPPSAKPEPSLREQAAIAAWVDVEIKAVAVAVSSWDALSMELRTTKAERALKEKQAEAARRQAEIERQERVAADLRERAAKRSQSSHEEDEPLPAPDSTRRTP